MQVTEDNLTQWFRDQRSLDPQKVPIGIGDDMAQINLAPHDSVLITTDMLLEGIHFDLNQASLEQVGYKSMAASLSDCAAMACNPTGAVISLGLPRTFDTEQLKELYQGLLKAGDRFDCPIVGGDLTRGSKALVINVAMFGVSMQGQPIRRSGARPGDNLLVTGDLGGSLAGGHLDFTPRLSEARRLVELATIHAMMDLSDGLSRDLPRLCQASGVGAKLERNALPLSAAAQNSPDPVSAALDDGEDFELLLAVDADDTDRLLKAWDLPTPLYRIGQCTSDTTIQIQNQDGHWETLSPGGYDHFSQDTSS